MVVSRPGPRPPTPSWGRGLIAEAERYLRRQGPRSFMRGQFPLNPFLLGDLRRKRVGRHPLRRMRRPSPVVGAGFEPGGTTVPAGGRLYPTPSRATLAPFDPRLTHVRSPRCAAPNWWGRWPSGEFRPTAIAVDQIDRPTGARHTWDMNWFGRGDGHARIGLIDLEVNPSCRRKGYGRYSSPSPPPARSDMVPTWTSRPARTKPRPWPSTRRSGSSRSRGGPLPPPARLATPSP